jgi:hypothetical protein
VGDFLYPAVSGYFARKKEAHIEDIFLGGFEVFVSNPSSGLLG